MKIEPHKICFAIAALCILILILLPQINSYLAYQRHVEEQLEANARPMWRM